MHGEKEDKRDDKEVISLVFPGCFPEASIESSLPTKMTAPAEIVLSDPALRENTGSWAGSGRSKMIGGRYRL